MLTLIAKPKPVERLTTLIPTPSPYRVCRDKTHQPFHYWRVEVQEAVCDVCEWSTAYQGSMGHLWQYPEAVREPLRKALERRGISIQE